MVTKKNITASYHHSFAGGSKNTSRLLHFLSQNGCNVEAYFFEKPQFFSYTKSNVSTHVLSLADIHSEVIDASAIKNYSFTNKIIEGLNEKADNILFGANLFPYCNVLLDVKSQLKYLLNSNPKLILHPVGSDIWQIGPQIKSRVKWLLDNPLVDTVVTYSESFITDIKEYYDIKKEIKVLPPVLESSKFFPLSKVEKSVRRKLLGFADDNFIIHHHSSMRKIKCPEIILDIAMKSAQLISDKCILIMAGPVPYPEIASLNLNLESLTGKTPFIYQTDKENLTIYWTGILPNVEYLLQVADIELNASLYDSFNLALMEAMACSVPVVTSDVVGVGKHILKAEAGYCFPTSKLKYDELNEVINSENSKSYLFDIDYAISAVSSIAEGKTASEIMGQKGANYVAAEFNYTKVTDEFYKLIE
jgi:L-malate glycosyltransferase